jgi:helix-turn-helix protein
MNSNVEGTAFVDESPLDPDHFYLLYCAVLERNDPEAFYRDALAILGCGRLGLCPETLAHLHEGWIDWQEGTITVPEREQCGCDRCVEPTGGDRSDGREESEWRPPPGIAARTVPFDWCRRLTCVLLEFFDRQSHLTLQSSLETKVATLAERAPGLDPERVSVPTLRASAAMTFADLGFDERRLQDVMGVDGTVDVRRFVRLGSGFGRGETLVPDDRFESRYRVVGDSTPFDGEFENPNEYDREHRRNRARHNRSTSTRITNPRGAGEGAEWDTESAVEFLDADGNLVSVQSGGVESFVHAWVARDDDRRETASGHGRADPEAGPETETERRGAAPPSAEGLASDPPPESGNREDAGVGDSDSGGSRVGVVETAPSVAVDTSRETYDVEFVAPSLTAPSPVDGQLHLGEDRLALDVSGARVDGTTFLLELGAISGFAFDYDPGSGVDFSGGVGLAVDWRGDTETVAISFECPRTDFASELLAALFEGREAIVSNPVKQGGRVNREADTRRCQLRFEDGRLLGEAPDSESSLLTIDLSCAAGVESTTQQYEGSEVPSVEITYTVGQSAKTAQAGFPRRRLARLFSQLSRVYYHRQRERMHQLTLDEDEKEFLVSLHSMGASGGLDFAQLLDVDSDDFAAFVAELERKGVVERTDDGTELTGLGRTVVNERIDDVNL